MYSEEMVSRYFQIVCERAWRSAVSHLFGETLPHRFAVGLLALAALAVPFAYVRWFNPTGSEFSDAVNASGLAFGAYLMAGILWFVIFAIFIAPYQLWIEQNERADRAETALTGTEAARIVQECTSDGVVDLERLRKEMDRITDPRREFHEEWDRLVDPKSALTRSAKATARRVRDRLLYLDRILASGDQQELIKWQRKAGGQLVFQVDRLSGIDANQLPETDGDRLEYVLHLIADLNENALMISRGEGYIELAQAAGMQRGRAEKLFEALAELAGIHPDWKAHDDGDAPEN